MHRVLAALVAVTVSWTSAATALQHVHAYADHDHADHQHGPSSHAHGATTHVHRSDAHAPDVTAHAPHTAAHAPHAAAHSPHTAAHAPGVTARLESCDPGGHAVPVVFTGVAPQPGYAAPVFVTLDWISVPPPKQTWRHVIASDARSHSPPRLTDAPLRAPPVVCLA